MMTRSKKNIIGPDRKYYMFDAVTHLEVEPNSVAQALKDGRWCNAMSVVFDAHVQNHTWVLVPRKPIYNLVGFRWVFLQGTSSCQRFSNQPMFMRFLIIGLC
ncbi:Retrovirus-related Pol polyprotein from transposon RE1 [Cardamine amara subsp. amara]|uniref:Retrovirus-related Pol polyprotein from transposon RE1 n=1 Tax=Cardamine amara subsp. amara TaxID=228776 RepID=A0ABD0ZW44_CARAN